MGVAVVALAYGGYVLWRWMSKRKVADDTNPKRKRGSILGDPRWRVGLACGGVLLVAAVVAAPWYLAVESQNPGFFRYYFFDRHLLGLASDTQPHSDQPWWYYLPVLLGGGLPWIGYLPVLGIRGRGKGDRSNLCEAPFGPFRQIGPVPFSARNPKSEIRNSSSPIPLLWCWLIGWTVFLTFAQSKLATYLWPAFPPLAILAAIVWAKVIADEGSGLGGQGLGQIPAGMNSDPRTLNPISPLSDAARRSFARTFVWSSWTGPLLLPTVVLVVQLVYAVPFSWPVWVAVGLVAAISPMPIIPWRAGRRQASLAAAAISLAAQFVVVMAFVLPPVANVCSARELAEHFNRLGILPPRLFVAEERIGSLVFYLTPRLRAGLKDGQLQNLLRDRPPPLKPGDVVAIQKVSLSRAEKYLDLSGCPYESVGRYRLYHIVSPTAGRHSVCQGIGRPRQTKMSAPPTHRVTMIATAARSRQTSPAAGRPSTGTWPPSSPQPRRSARRWDNGPPKRSAGSPLISRAA